MVSARRPFGSDLIATVDQLGEALRAEAKPHGGHASLPLPGGDAALLEASADAATLLARLLGAIVAFDAGDDDQAEDLIQSTAVCLCRLFWVWPTFRDRLGPGRACCEGLPDHGEVIMVGCDDHDEVLGFCCHTWQMW